MGVRGPSQKVQKLLGARIRSLSSDWFYLSWMKWIDSKPSISPFCLYPQLPLCANTCLVVSLITHPFLAITAGVMWPWWIPSLQPLHPAEDTAWGPGGVLPWSYWGGWVLWRWALCLETPSMGHALSVVGSCSAVSTPKQRHFTFRLVTCWPLVMTWSSPDSTAKLFRLLSF